MKYCTHCGAQIVDEAYVCPNCGCLTETAKKTNDSKSAVKLAAEILMIISCVAFAIFVIPLCWMVPMTIYYFRKVKNNEPVSVGFAVCTLLFVNTIAGVLMLIEDKV